MPGIREKGRLKSALQVVLVIANSGRMLAHAVRQAGYRPLVIDLFADQDTKAIAEQLWQVDNFSLAVVQSVIEHLLLSHKIQWVIYGSGLENQPETLEYLAENFTLTGNNAAVCKQLSCKKVFFKQLDKLNIRYPEVRFCSPENTDNWIIKPIKHVGGLGISWCSRSAKEDEYYQEFCAGQPGSVLFCADGERFELIGFHRQWTVAQDNFAFAGIVQESVLPEAEQQRVQGWLKKLVNYYHLKGLGSLDFIWDGETCYFLEINPRPPASMMLYSELDLLSAHLTGRLTGFAEVETIRTLQIIYAKQPCKVTPLFEWPEWSFDRPNINTSLHTNEPICSIIAQEETVQQALDSLLARQQFIENNLY